MNKLLSFLFLSSMLVGCTNIGTTSLTLEEAQIIALKEVNGDVLKSKENREDEMKCYGFTILSNSEKYEIEIDARTGEIIKKEKVIDNERAKTSISFNQEAYQNDTLHMPIKNENREIAIRAETAKEIAVSRVGGGSVVECKFEYDDGISKYEIEIIDENKEYDLDINAITGAVTKYEEESIR